MERINQKLCCIVGFDGHDQCLLYSLAAFYLADGYDIVYGKHPIKCDLLVIYRGDSPSEIRYEEFTSQIHYYGACWEPKGVEVKKLESIQHTIIVASPYTAAKTHSGNSNQNVLVSYLPVNLSPWTTINNHGGVSERCQDIPHVGRPKKSMLDIGDKATKDFIDFALKQNIKLYDRNWQEVAPSHQVVDKFIGDDIAEFYSRHRCTAGIQYNYQRGKIISARFWEAPLSGCALLSETTVNGRDSCPGVVVVDYSTLDNSKLEFMLTAFSPKELSEIAMQYWQHNNQSLAAKLGMHKAHEQIVNSQIMNFTNVKGGDHYFIDAANLG